MARKYLLQMQLTANGVIFTTEIETGSRLACIEPLSQIYYELLYMSAEHLHRNDNIDDRTLLYLK